MSALSENIAQAINDFNDIQDAIVEKGVEIPNSTPTSEYGNKIRQIETSSDWQPHPDWWDIRTMVDTGIVPWLDESLANVRYSFIVPDSNATTTLPSGYQYYLSDGSYYDGTAQIVHTWDRTKDKNCEDGYKTRAVIVCGSSRNVTISHRAFGYDGVDSLYIYLGDCYLVSLITAGVSTATYINRVIQAVECNENTDAASEPFGSYAMYGNTALQKVMVPKGAFYTGINAFRYCNALQSITLPSTIRTLRANAFNSCYSLITVTLPVDISFSAGDATFSNNLCIQSVVLVGNANVVPGIFGYCYNLQSVLVPADYNNHLSLDGTNSIRLSISAMENIIYNYADRTDQTALTFTIGTTNLAKLSDETKAIAASKNITLA